MISPSQAQATLLHHTRRIDETKAITPWLVCMVAASYFFYEFIQMNMFNAISTDLMQTFHISGASLGKLSAAFFYADALLLIPAGILLDRLSVRRIILTALGVCIISTFLFANAHVLWFAIVCHFAAGMGNAFCFLSSMLLASRWFPSTRLALVVGLIVTFGMLGGAVAQAPLQLLTAHIGWRLAVVMNAGFGVLIWGFIWWFVYDRPLDPARNYSHNAQPMPLENIPLWQAVKITVRTWQTWLAGLYTSTLNLPLMVMGGLWGNLFLQQVYHFSATDAVTISTMLFIGTIVGAPVFGAFSDRILRRKLPMIIGAVLSLAMTLPMLYLPHLNMITALILFFLVGFATSAQVISYPLLTESQHRSITATTVGIASVLIMFGAGLAEQVFGWVIDAFWDKTLVNGVPQYSVHAYHAAAMLFPITLIVGLICSLLVRETACKNLK